MFKQGFCNFHWIMLHRQSYDRINNGNKNTPVQTSPYHFSTFTVLFFSIEAEQSFRQGYDSDSSTFGVP
jgi:hypothetical protein